MVLPELMLFPPPIPQLPLPLPLPMPQLLPLPEPGLLLPSRVGCWPSRVGFRHQSPATEHHRRCRRVDYRPSRADYPRPRRATGSHRRCRRVDYRPNRADCHRRVRADCRQSGLEAGWVGFHPVRAGFHRAPVGFRRAPVDCRRSGPEAAWVGFHRAPVDYRRCRREGGRAVSCCPHWAGSEAMSGRAMLPGLGRFWACCPVGPFCGLAGSWALTAAPSRAGSGAWRVWSCRRPRSCHAAACWTRHAAARWTCHAAAARTCAAPAALGVGRFRGTQESE